MHSGSLQHGSVCDVTNRHSEGRLAYTGHLDNQKISFKASTYLHFKKSDYSANRYFVKTL